jgi:lipopolysaccharide export system permease protein
MLFDSTLRRELARSFGATLIVLVTIVLTVFLIRTLGQAASGRIGVQDVALLLGYTSVGHLSTILALSLFISIMLTLGRMYQDSEMTVWFASGASLMQFMRPVMRLSLPVLVVIALLVLVVWPWANQRSTLLKQNFERRSDLSRVAPGQFQSSADGKRVFFIERTSDEGRTGRNVFILMQSQAKESVTTSHVGRVIWEGERRYLVLEQGQRNEQDLQTGEKTLSRFESYKILISENVDPATQPRAPTAQRTIELLRNPTPAHQGELAWRIGMILGALNLMLLGVGLPAQNNRRANNWNLVFALLAFLVYFNLINLTQSWVSQERLSLSTSLLLLHGSAFALAWGLIAWRTQGATLFKRPVQQARPAGGAMP